MSAQDITNLMWFEEENDLIKSCGALQSALGLSRSFSTGDIAADVCCTNADSADNGDDDIRTPHSASEPAINKLRIDSDVSRSLSTCVVVGDTVQASTSQLPSPPNRYSSSPLQNSGVPSSSAFSPTDLVRSVNKKVRQNYIQRRLLNTYKTLGWLSQSWFNLDKTVGECAAGPGKYLSVPRSGKPALRPDDIAVCTDTIKRYQPKAFPRYDQNIVNWLDNIDPQNAEVEDQIKTPPRGT